MVSTYYYEPDADIQECVSETTSIRRALDTDRKLVK